jgi:flagellar M-ring protein FliF
VLQLKPGQQLSSQQVRGVVNLVSHSVEGLKPENVTVLDGDGVTLSGQDDNSLLSAGASSTQREAQRSYEQSLQRDIQAMLEQVLGPRKAVVRVNATMDWDQHESSSETYSPSGLPTQVRSSHEVVERSAVPLSDGSFSIPTYPIDGRTPAGPVSPSATPTVVATPQATPQALASATATALTGSVADPKYERRDVTNNYEISKLTEKTVKAPGSVKKLSVSVLLDGQLDDATTSTITKAVTAAAGLDTTRGDSVVVASLPFDQSASVAEQKAAEESSKRELYTGVAKGAMVVVSLLVVMLLVRSLIKGLTRDPNAPRKVKGKKVKGKDEPLELPEGAAQQAVAALKAAPREEDPRPAQVLRDVTQLAQNEPQLVAQIVKSWLDEKG